MRISVKAKPKAKKEKVERLAEDRFIVAVSAPAEKGLANEAIEKALAEYFSVPRSRVTIVAGRTSREKIVEIEV